MEVSCNGCGTRYAVRDERMLAGEQRFRCRHCGETIDPSAARPSRVASTGPHPTAASPRLSSADIFADQPTEGTISFSLDEIRRLSQVTAPQVVRPSIPPAGHASGDDSGLVSMAALAAAPEPSLDHADPLTASKLVPDSLAPAELRAASQAAPMGTPLETKIYAGLAGLALTLMGIVGIIAVTREPPAQQAQVPVQPVAAAQPVAALPSEPAVAPEPPAAEEAEDTEGAAGTEGEAEADEEGALAGQDTQAEPEAAVDEPVEKKPTVRSAKKKRTARRKPAATRKVAKTSSTKAKKSESFDDLLAGGAAPKKAPSQSSGSASIDDLLSGAVNKGSSSKQPAKADKPAASTLPTSPSRDQIVAALSSAKAKVKRCGGSGIATAAIKVSGKTGKVSRVDVSGAEGAAAACVKKAVMGARFPKFQKPSFSVKYPFRM